MTTSDSWSTARARAEQILASPLPQAERRRLLGAAIGLLDLTTLNATDTPGAVRALCARARRPLEADGGAHVATACVHSSLVGVASEALDGSAVRPCAVAGAFPHGQAPLSVKIAEVRAALEAGAAEIDIVINRGMLLDGKLEQVVAEVGAMREPVGATPGAILKVILETCEIPDAELLREVAAAVIEQLGPGDFLKTSTGKGAAGATPEGAVIMLETIASAARAGKAIGFKAAGGLRTPEDAISYMRLAAAIAGPDWLDPQRLRLGASTLLDRLAQALA
ncbi:MAG: deoxyribose-phosphate aldolase [Phycisphaerales bacterium JB039]